MKAYSRKKGSSWETHVCCLTLKRFKTICKEFQTECNESTLRSCGLPGWITQTESWMESRLSSETNAASRHTNKWVKRIKSLFQMAKTKCWPQSSRNAVKEPEWSGLTEKKNIKILKINLLCVKNADRKTFMLSSENWASAQGCSWQKLVMLLSFTSVIDEFYSQFLKFNRIFCLSCLFFFSHR